jgi:hypothetical protein
MFLGKKSPIFNIKIMFFNIWAASWVNPAELFSQIPSSLVGGIFCPS